MLGVGDTIPKGQFILAVKLKKRHPKALNILMAVNANKEEKLTKSEVRKSVSSEKIYQNSLGTLQLGSLTK